MSDGQIVQSDTGGFLRAARNSEVIRFRASTDMIDRHRSIVVQRGIDSRNYSGGFLWGHDSFKGMFGGTPKIENQLGKVVSKSITTFMRRGKRAEATDVDVRFSKVNPFGVLAEGMVREGVLGNVSISFIPKQSHKEEIKKEEIRIYDKTELLEISLVPVPSNPEAQAIVRAMGVGLQDVLIGDESLGVQRRETDEGDWFWNDEQGWSFRAPKEMRKIEDLIPDIDSIRGIVPSNISTTKAPEDQRWSTPAIKDFRTSISTTWEGLTLNEKRQIMGHFAWSPSGDTTTFRFNEMELPHHDPGNGSVVLKGVNAAMGTLLGARGGVNLPSGDRRKVYNHLAAHIRSFDRVPPPFRSVDDPPPTGAELGSVGKIVSQTVREWTENLQSN